MKQSGNALFLILIAVALFAALSYAVTQSGRGGGNVNREVVKTDAARLVQYAGQITQAVQKLMLIGACSENEISFHYDSDGDGTLETTDDYYNASAPTDLSCHVFQQNGGGLTLYNNFDNIRDTATLNGGDFWDSYDFLFLAFADFEGIGTNGGGDSSMDLHMILPQLTEEACNEINRSIGVTGTNIQDTDIAMGTSSSDLFDGTYGDGSLNRDIFDEAIGADMVGEYRGCLDEIPGTGSAGYHYYEVILAR